MSATMGAWECRHGVDGRDYCADCYSDGEDIMQRVLVEITGTNIRSYKGLIGHKAIAYETDSALKSLLRLSPKARKVIFNVRTYVQKSDVQFSELRPTEFDDFGDQDATS